MLKLTHHGNPSIGAFCRANNNVAFMASDSTNKLISYVESQLKVEVVKATIFNSGIIGIYSSINSNHILLPYFTEKREIEKIKCYVEPVVVKTKENAWGNLVVMNDRGAILSPYLNKETISFISNSLGLDVVVSSIAGYKSVGAVAFATNKGALISYKASKEEIKLVEDVLKVKTTTASINMGSQFISLGLIANEKGYVVGELTTGVEIARIEEGLDLIR